MGKKLYVGNLNYRTEDDALAEAFGEFGEVVSAKVITDKETGRSRGFGFVEMAEDDAAIAAIEGLNGKELEGRALKINEAIDKPRR